LTTALKNILSEIRCNNNDFEEVHDETLNVYAEFNMKIPKVRKRPISCIVDLNEHTQHVTESKKEDMKYPCYFLTLDEILSGLNHVFIKKCII
jgi:hypothetical protein